MQPGIPSDTSERLEVPFRSEPYLDMAYRFLEIDNESKFYVERISRRNRFYSFFTINGGPERARRLFPAQRVFYGVGEREMKTIRSREINDEKARKGL